jgi:3-methyladenine DNA glycosylase/8-oxoguanine DNA glycosylase
MVGPDAVLAIEVDGPLDLRRTVRPLAHGGGDPTTRVTVDGLWRATRVGGEAATIHVVTAIGPRLGPTTVRARAWGPGAAAAIGTVPDLVGVRDDRAGFTPGHPLVRRLDREHPGLRIPRSGAVVEALLPTILEQKVTGREATRAFRGLVRRYGEPAPGPAPLMLPPRPEVLATLGYADFHPFGVERARAERIRRMAAVSGSLDACAALPLAAAYERLAAVPGIGAWTAAEVALVALGDADAVSVGDYHLPHLVAFALAGEPRADDDRMLELLEPWRGHRARVVRLLETSGVHAPRRGPRMRLRNIQRH